MSNQSDGVETVAAFRQSTVIIGKLEWEIALFRVRSAYSTAHFCLKFTKNKTHLVLGTLLVLMGLALMAAAFAALERSTGRFSPAAFASLGIVLVLAGITFLFGKPLAP